MYSQVAANKRKTIYLMVLFVVLIGALGYVISLAEGTPSLFIGVLIFAVVYAAIGYWASAKIALAISGAKPVTKKEAPRLYRAVENLSITAGLPTPKVYIIDDPALNAFATGRSPDKAVVAVTSGLLEALDNQELEGVLAHEMSHIGNYDIRVMGIVLVLVTIIALISDIFLRMMFWGRGRDRNSSPVFLFIGIAAAVIAPIAATLLKLAVSRKREYLADASGALLTRYPDGLANALAKISHSKQDMRHANTATAHLFIANPFRGRHAKNWLTHLFSTHPPAEERIKRLKDMKDKL